MYWLRTYARHLAGGLVAGLLLVLLAGCGGRPVAAVNGKAITEQEFVKRLKQEAGERVLMGMIARQLVVDAFDKSGLELDQAKVDEQLADWQKQFPDEDTAKEQLAKSGLTMDDVREEMALSVKAEMLQAKDVRYTDADLKAFFETQRTRFDKPARATFRGIWVGTQEAADKVYALALKPESAFADLVRQYSMSPETRQKDGLIENFPLEGEAIAAMPAELLALLKATQPGKVAKPIRLGNQWIVIKLEERKPAEKADFEKAKPEIEEIYKASKAKAPEAMFQELQASANVTVYDPMLQGIQEQFKADQEVPDFGTGSKTGAPEPGAAPVPAQPGEPPAAPGAPGTP